MPDTYDTAAEAEADRTQQKVLLAALNGWDRALRRDERGAWRISRARGSIHTCGDGKSWILFVGCRSATHWTYTKRRLAFCSITQDGEDEGCLQLHQLPTAEQAEVIRDVLGIRKRVELGPEELERRRALGKRLALAAGLANEAGAVPYAPPRASGSFRRRSHQMSGHRIRIPGYRLNKAGELVPDMRRLSVSERLRRTDSKRVRVATTAPGTRRLNKRPG